VGGLVHPGHLADGISTSHCRNSVSDKCCFFLIDAKTSIGFMLAHYLNSEVFARAMK
jgi:hypothetical protein